MSALSRITTGQAIAVLLEDAVGDPALVQAKFAEAAQRDPNGIKALLRAAGVETLGNVSGAAESGSQNRFPLVIGQPVTDPGVPFGEWKSGDKTIGLHFIPDYLRNASGQIVRLNADQALDAITAFNEGTKYGNGYEKANARAIAEGEFKDGTLILAGREDLLKIAREWETNPALKSMNDIIASRSNVVSWCVSSTENSCLPSHVAHVSLKDGDFDWSYKDRKRSRVVVLRGVALG